MIGFRNLARHPRTKPVRPAERGLDWLNLFVANIQTGFGPFIALYLTTQGWTQSAIGFALSLGTITAMASQVPAGALVDAIRYKSLVAAFSVLVFTGSALIFALKPVALWVYLAEILHGFSSCTLGPSIAAMSLMVAGQTFLSARLGRNVRYASIGNGLGAVMMGLCGYLVSNQAVFFLTALLTLPALAAIVPLSRIDIDIRAARRHEAAPTQAARAVLANPTLLVFAGTALLFTLANAAMLPLASVALTKRAGDAASLLIAACVVLPQAIVALLSPLVASLAQSRGRRVALLLGFGMLPLKGVLFATVPNPVVVVFVQSLDGIAAASFGILVPLVCADLTGRSGHFNLALGSVGFAIGIGATLSTTLAGLIADQLGDPSAFGALATVGAAATLLVWLAMPETRPVGA